MSSAGPRSCSSWWSSGGAGGPRCSPEGRQKYPSQRPRSTSREEMGAKRSCSGKLSTPRAGQDRPQLGPTTRLEPGGRIEQTPSPQEEPLPRKTPSPPNHHGAPALSPNLSSCSAPSVVCKYLTGGREGEALGSISEPTRSSRRLLAMVAAPDTEFWGFWDLKRPRADAGPSAQP